MIPPVWRGLLRRSRRTDDVCDRRRTSEMAIEAYRGRSSLEKFGEPLHRHGHVLGDVEATRVRRYCCRLEPYRTQLRCPRTLARNVGNLLAGLLYHYPFLCPPPANTGKHHIGILPL